MNYDMIMQLYFIELFFLHQYILGFRQKYHKINIFSKELAWLKYYDQYFFVPDLSPMTTARKATPSEDPVECGGTSPLGKAVKMAVM